MIPWTRISPLSLSLSRSLSSLSYPSALSLSPSLPPFLSLLLPPLPPPFTFLTRTALSFINIALSIPCPLPPPSISSSHVCLRASVIVDRVL